MSDGVIYPTIGVILMVAITVILAGLIAWVLLGASETALLFPPEESWERNITIISVDIGGPNEPYFIMDTDGFTYGTKSKWIFNTAERSIGKNATIRYYPGENQECMVYDIKIISERNMCKFNPSSSRGVCYAK